MAELASPAATPRQPPTDLEYLDQDAGTLRKGRFETVPAASIRIIHPSKTANIVSTRDS